MTPDISGDRLHIRDLAPSVSATAGLIGLAGLIVAVALGVVTGNSEAFFRGYLVALCFAVSIMLGGLFFVLIQHVTRAGWSVVVRRFAEQVSMTAFPLAVLSLVVVLPMIFGWPESIHDVFRWTDPRVTDSTSGHYDALIAGKSGYLNVPFFFFRMLIYFGFWIAAANYFYRASVQQDQSRDGELTLAMQRLSAPGLLLFALTTTFFAVDLLMSLDPHWFSTIFGVYYFAGSVVAFCSLLALAMFLLQQAGRATQSLNDEHYHDVGKLMFAFVVFWAYIAYSQYMLIWYGNLPEETGWLIVRQDAAWLPLTLWLLFGHFIIPFLGLISRVPKRRKDLLVFGAVWLLVMHWLDICWLVLPHVTHAGGADGHGSVPAPGAIDVLQVLLCTVGVSGVFVWSLVRRMAQSSLIPEGDPRLAESLSFENN